MSSSSVSLLRREQTLDGSPDRGEVVGLGQAQGVGIAGGEAIDGVPGREGERKRSRAVHAESQTGRRQLRELEEGGHSARIG